MSFIRVKPASDKLLYFFSFFLYLCFIIIYNSIIIKHIKQNGMIKNKICQLDKG